eukprot:NODE_7161_length_461_cov_4.425150_g6995_i0.p2 GENE.NODE_7161_length_461_cov_4.425150_g6995_i0~~NODE_7161_length_461_cov_4.425150_g6995_i0.p2  ORF type:complete len:123 (+),score=34.14 NODE_7161_length_461_cov_4.425150_g6995_i0:30-371(+)
MDSLGSDDAIDKMLEKRIRHVNVGDLGATMKNIKEFQVEEFDDPEDPEEEEEDVCEAPADSPANTLPLSMLLEKMDSYEAKLTQVVAGLRDVRHKLPPSQGPALRSVPSFSQR